MNLCRRKTSRRNKTVSTRRPELNEIAVAPVWDKYSTYPSNGFDSGCDWRKSFARQTRATCCDRLELFEEMEEKDPHLFSQLRHARTRSPDWTSKSSRFSDDEWDKQIAEFVKEQIDGLENFEDIMMDLLDAIGKGISVSEIIWGYDDGFTVVEDIKWRHPKRLLWDNQDTLKVVTRDNPSGIPLPENKFVIHRYKARSGHPSRAGVLRVVAWMYLFKNYDLKDWVSFCEVFGMPLRLGKYDPSASDDDKAALMRALVQIGTDAAGIIPDGTEIEFKEAAKTTSINVYESLARYCDEQISKAVLGQTLTSDSGGGSFAQSKTHNEVRHDLTVADCKALAATLRRDLIRPLVYFNYGESRRIPHLRFDCEEAGDLKETADIYGKLIDMGLKIPTSHLYKKFSVPKPENGEEVAAPLSHSAPMPFKDKTLVAVANKGNRPGVTQGSVDQLADAAIQNSKGIFGKIFAPVLKILDTANSLEEVKAKLEDERFAGELYQQMDIEDLDELLHKAMFYADLMGRVEEHARMD
ncbi:DUF935 domain-containing protein [Paenibacillus melissococcoides]|nr:DUF935 domain-containing protein [Paenibacillus melissococcoides]